MIKLVTSPGDVYFWVSVCCWDFKVLNLKQIKLRCILQAYTGLNTEIPNLSQPLYT